MRTPFEVNIEHYESQHTIGGRSLYLNVPLAYDKDKIKEIVHGCGDIAYSLLFHSERSVPSTQRSKTISDIRKPTARAGFRQSASILLNRTPSG